MPTNFKYSDHFRVPTQMSWIIFRTFQDIFELIFRTFQDIFELIFKTFQDIFELISMTFLPKNVEGIWNFKEMEQQSSFQIPINLSIRKFINFQDIFSFPGHSRTFQKVGTLSFYFSIDIIKRNRNFHGYYNFPRSVFLKSTCHKAILSL